MEDKIQLIEFTGVLNKKFRQVDSGYYLLKTKNENDRIIYCQTFSLWATSMQVIMDTVIFKNLDSFQIKTSG